MKKIGHDDVVLFDDEKQMKEYIELSGDTIFFEIEIKNSFPQIQSKHWSFCITEKHQQRLWEVKKTALKRLISYKKYKELNHE